MFIVGSMALFMYVFTALEYHRNAKLTKHGSGEQRMLPAPRTDIIDHYTSIETSTSFERLDDFIMGSTSPDEEQLTQPPQLKGEVPLRSQIQNITGSDEIDKYLDSFTLDKVNHKNANMIGNTATIISTSWEASNVLCDSY